MGKLIDLIFRRKKHREALADISSKLAVASVLLKRDRFPRTVNGDLVYAFGVGLCGATAMDQDIDKFERKESAAETRGPEQPGEKWQRTDLYYANRPGDYEGQGNGPAERAYRLWDEAYVKLKDVDMDKATGLDNVRMIQIRVPEHPYKIREGDCDEVKARKRDSEAVDAGEEDGKDGDEREEDGGGVDVEDEDAYEL